jgi:hypothetical protein
MTDLNFILINSRPAPPEGRYSSRRIYPDTTVGTAKLNVAFPKVLLSFMHNPLCIRAIKFLQQKHCDKTSPRFQLETSLAHLFHRVFAAKCVPEARTLIKLSGDSAL